MEANPVGRPREINRVAIGESIAVLFCRASGGKFFGVTIDKEDLPRVVAAGKWQIKVNLKTKRFYSQKNLNGHKVLLHRFLVKTKSKLDHANGRGLDNRKSNIRKATPSQNNINRPGIGRWFKGVTTSGSGKYRAAITHNGKRHHIGIFATPKEAAKAYDRTALEIFGEFAWLNFPMEVTA